MKKPILLKSNLLMGLLLTSLCLLIMVGCSQGQGQAKNPSVAEIRDQIAASVDISELIEQEKDELATLYNIDTADVDEAIVYIAPTNLQADELTIIKLKDGADVEEIKELIAQTVEQQANSFKDYLPEEYDLIEKHVLKSKGNYILLAISEKADKIEDIFDKSFE